jgi:hypothetical protein
MSKTKIVTFVLLIAMLVVAAVPARSALAASGSATIGSGTITGIAIETDPVTLTSTVVVSLLDSDGLSQTVRVSLETAVTLALITPNALMVGQSVTIVDEADPLIITTGVIDALAFATTGTPPVTTVTVTLTDAGSVQHILTINLEHAITLGLVATNAALIGTAIVIDPIVIVESGTYGKIVTKLGTFFGSLGVDFATIQAYQTGGAGYGVITQALWMTYLLGGDAAMFDQIMAAKFSGDFSAIVLPDGSTATSWGSLRKAVLTSGKFNLGQIMSGKAAAITTATTTATTTTTSKGNGNGKSNDTVTTTGNGNSNGNGNGNSGGNGKGNGNGKKP